jgi:hypothetical protein
MKRSGAVLRILTVIMFLYGVLGPSVVSVIARDAAEHVDTDRDAVDDGADDCATVAHPDQPDPDGDGLGDACVRSDERDRNPASAPAGSAGSGAAEHR